MSDQDDEIDLPSDQGPSESVESSYPGAVKFSSSKTYVGENGERWSKRPGNNGDDSAKPDGLEPADVHSQKRSPTTDSRPVDHTPLQGRSAGSRVESERVEGLDPRLGPQNGISRVAIEAALRQIPTGENPLRFLESRGWIVREMRNIYYACEGDSIWLTALRALIEEYAKIEGREGTASSVDIHDDDDETADQYKIGKMYEMASRNQTPAQFLESRGWKVRSGYATDDDGSSWRTVSSALVEEYDKIQRRKVVDRQDY